MLKKRGLMTCPSDERLPFGVVFLFCSVMIKFVVSVVLVLVALVSGVLASQETSEFMQENYKFLSCFCLMITCLVSYLGFKSSQERIK